MIAQFKWFVMAVVLVLTACSQPKTDTEAAKPTDEVAKPTDEAAKPTDEAAKPTDEAILQANWSKAEAKWTDALALGQFWMAQNRYDEVLRLFYEAETKFGSTPEIQTAYADALAKHPDLHATPRELIVGKDITGMKRLGGGSSLIYRFYKDKQIIAAFKPFQKRFQSNYRSEIAAYRLCPAMKCGFDVPMNIPVYFDFDVFSSLYARNAANPKEEFKEIIPTKLENGKYRVNGTYKAWIPDFADYPIEFTEIWKPWLNPGTPKAELQMPAQTLLPKIAQKHARGDKFAKKLMPHLENLSVYGLARQISNLIVFDFLINNWDRFSGADELKGINCQIAHGRFMSIDNGASFSQTPHAKPQKHLHEISRFSRMTYEAIKNFNKEEMKDYLFPNANEFEIQKFETFWSQRQAYLDYVELCISKNGNDETFFFE